MWRANPGGTLDAQESWRNAGRARILAERWTCKGLSGKAAFIGIAISKTSETVAGGVSFHSAAIPVFSTEMTICSAVGSIHLVENYSLGTAAPECSSSPATP